MSRIIRLLFHLLYVVTAHRVALEEALDNGNKEAVLSLLVANQYLFSSRPFITEPS